LLSEFKLGLKQEAMTMALAGAAWHILFSEFIYH